MRASTGQLPALEQTAHALVAPGRGILAADESGGTMDKRLIAAGIAPSIEARRRFRELVFTAAEAAEHISGAIMYDETIRQSGGDGKPFVDVLAEHGVLTGIKVDTGAKPLAGAPGETITEGLDGLRERLAEYQELGACFAKWRAVFTSARADRAAALWPPTRTRSPATPPSARRPGSCRSSSPRY